ncbi:alpha/beta fold hydrolase [Vibrio sp. MA40-2]|uniref:alpha/beta fold hydrolase n=1 Tax=Vibrio sp. MA40-2 TaxID=3391828 RepID=UPI0039A6E99E
MKSIRNFIVFLVLQVFIVPVQAADYMEATTGEYTIKNFKFENGYTMPEMKIAYRTFGNPQGEPVLLLHGTHGDGAKMMSKALVEHLFSAGKALDAQKYFFIAPDAIGTGDSTKPSDGLKASFPVYNYHDMVNAQYDLLKNHLGINHLRSIFGYSMGGMLAFDWAIMYPNFMDSIVPTAAFPGPMSGRNWAMRKLLVDSIRRDPVWNNGNYTEVPPSFLTARIWFSTAFYLSEKRMTELYPDHESFNQAIEKKYAVTDAPDANDAMYQWGASRDFDPTNDLNKIKAHVLVINEDGDPRNPVELDTLSLGMEKIVNGDSFMISGTGQYSGHGTVYHFPWLYEGKLAQFMANVPKM